MEGLSEEERKALRGSKFAPLPPPSSSRPQKPRLAHPGGPLKTNKAAALAKFLERKLQEPDGLTSIDPKLIQLAVKDAKETVSCSAASKSGRVIHHVNSFGDPEVPFEEETVKKYKKKKKKKKKQKMVDDNEYAKLLKPKKKRKTKL